MRQANRIFESSADKNLTKADLVGYFATRLIQRTLKNKILPKTKVDTGGYLLLFSHELI